MKKVIGILLFMFIVFSAMSVSFAAQIGNTSYGYVDKDVYGNQSSDDTIVVIVGVHPLENGTHTAITNELVNKSDSLSKRYVLYTVHVTQYASDNTKGRMNGQLLAQKFVVPDVAGENPVLVIDIHENRYKDSGYAYSRFLYPISNTELTKKYSREIISKVPFLLIYYPPNPTSPPYVTIPIANKGIPTIVYENYRSDSTARKAADASALINALDSLVIPKVVASPSGGNYYAPQHVALTSRGGSDIYYTINGSEPTIDSTKYTGSIYLNTTTLLKFTSFNSTGGQSPVYSEQYNIYKLVKYNYTVQVKWKKVYVKKPWKIVKGKMKYHWVKVWKYKTVNKTGTKWVLT
jgi:hypothetical protein